MQTKEMVALSYFRPAQILLGLKVHDEKVLRLHELLLHARRREEDVVAMPDRGASTCASDLRTTILIRRVYFLLCGPTPGERKRGGRRVSLIYPSVSVELSAQLANQVCWMIGVMRRDQCICSDCV